MNVFLLCIEIYPVQRVPSPLEFAKLDHIADICHGLRNVKGRMTHAAIISIVAASWNFPTTPWYALEILGPANATHIPWDHSCIHCHRHPADDVYGRWKHRWVLIIQITPLQSTVWTGLNFNRQDGRAIWCVNFATFVSFSGIPVDGRYV